MLYLDRVVTRRAPRGAKPNGSALLSIIDEMAETAGHVEEQRKQAETDADVRQKTNSNSQSNSKLLLMLLLLLRLEDLAIGHSCFASPLTHVTSRQLPLPR